MIINMVGYGEENKYPNLLFGTAEICDSIKYYDRSYGSAYTESFPYNNRIDGAFIVSDQDGHIYLILKHFDCYDTRYDSYFHCWEGLQVMNMNAGYSGVSVYQIIGATKPVKVKLGCYDIDNNYLALTYLFGYEDTDFVNDKNTVLCRGTYFAAGEILTPNVE